ncbi:hypothetical protein PRIC1_013831 [Phytophthora ramorum]
MLAQLVADVCPSSASFFGFMGVASALVFANLGAAYGTAKSGGHRVDGCDAARAGHAQHHPRGHGRCAGHLRLIVAVIIQGSIDPPNGNMPNGLAAGMAIGVVGDAGVRAVGQQEKLFVNMILILIFAEALGLYGLIVALILSQKKSDCPSE